MLMIFTLVAVVLYAAATGLQWQELKKDARHPSPRIKLIGAGAWLTHTISLYLLLHQDGAINLSLFNVGSLISWLVAGIVLISSLRQAISNLYLGVFPLAAWAALISLMVPETASSKPYSSGVIVHILLSILAYSLFTISVLQAILLHLQEKALKTHKTRGLVTTLPPLQVMERLLFESLGTGLALLTGSLLTGFLFFDDFFAQHLIHKTALSIIAWLLYAALLTGRTLFGWRSRTAIRWTVGSFSVLALAFFGSKIVIELFIGN